MNHRERSAKMPGHHHRASSLRQSNKKNKRSKSSKRSLTRSAGGKVNRRSPNSQKTLFAQSKADRRNNLQQKRDVKREALLKKKRGASGGPPPPRVIGIISLGSSEDIEGKLRNAILEGADKTARTLREDSEATITAKFDVHKKDGLLSILTNSTAFRGHYTERNDIDNNVDNSVDTAVQSALDLCRISDMVVFVIDVDGSKLDTILDMQIGGDEASVMSAKSHQRHNWDHLISERGDRVLNAIKGQGMPSLLTVFAHTEHEDRAADFMSVKSSKSIRRAVTKRAQNLKKYVSRFATTEFGPDNDTVVEVDISYFNDEEQPLSGADPEDEKRLDVASLVRALCTKPASPAKFISEAPRPYVVSDSLQYEPSKHELKVSGYIRGKVPLSVNSLVHIPNLGTFGCKAVVVNEELPLSHRGTNTTDHTPCACLVSNPLRQDSLNMFATPDALEGEQNLIGFDEDDEVASGMDGANEDTRFSRPAGWSDYQSAWLDAVDGMGEDGDGFDHGELAKELNKKGPSSPIAGSCMDIDGVDDISLEERRLLRDQRKKEENEHQEFPDEVEVDEDVQAFDRFARYRSLKSFRKTYWDPKENLPESYGCVFHFANFKATQRSVMHDMKNLADEAAALDGNFGKNAAKSDLQEKDIDMSDSDDENPLVDCVPCGSYVTVTLGGVSPEVIQSISLESLLTVVGLLPHENKVSVLHAGLSHSAGCNLDDLPIKSKDVLTFRCGWRTWKARPVFSQNNLNCNKHKFERFMPVQGAFFAATFFGPVTYAPCPVLVFREQKGKTTELCAVGSMLGADADRIVVKRIILTGYPVRVHKRHATVKYMFYNPEDVKWFKPAGLWTKHGLNGNIIESVGEHGTMKCLFNAPIKQHDTVCLPLYKRVFPKFAMGSDGDTSENGAQSLKESGKPALVIF